jgi:hypothetical protein
MEDKSDIRNNRSLIIFFRSLCFFTFCMGLAAFILFNCVKLMIGDNPYQAVLHIAWLRGYIFKGFDQDPYPFLLVIVFISSIIGASWTAFVAPKYTRHFILQILVIPWISLIITSPIWGMMWSFYLRSPAFFVENFPDNPKAVMWLYYRTDAIDGLKGGWIAALQSFPINILSYIAFCSILFASRKLFSDVNAHKNSYS